jgi:hypothetical protein
MTAFDRRIIADFEEKMAGVTILKERMTGIENALLAELLHDLKYVTVPGMQNKNFNVVDWCGKKNHAIWRIEYGGKGYVCKVVEKATGNDGSGNATMVLKIMEDSLKK